MGKTIRFSISIPEELGDKLEELLRRKGYKNRSEAFRDFIRASLVEEEWKDSRGEVVGVLSIVYDHHVRALSEKITEIEHCNLGCVVSSLHVHLDEDHCLEAIVLRGEKEKVQRISDEIISTKGVILGKLLAASTGKDLA
ncbi:MAG: nickel-responsive transcriptional regulator NikR [Caldiserica bacterium]|jgi:CopG family nickel-responsive transcriptional regulator|nr:nickel-responsive transcriptional regulator NikR [Caldisericota bacterium]MDH7562425.1 nickel-responsive transcriptional regulator NikR [Caldisericota bacterium]